MSFNLLQVARNCELCSHKHKYLSAHHILTASGRPSIIPLSYNKTLQPVQKQDTLLRFCKQNVFVKFLNTYLKYAYMFDVYT